MQTKLKEKIKKRNWFIHTKAFYLLRPCSSGFFPYGNSDVCYRWIALNSKLERDHLIPFSLHSQNHWTTFKGTRISTAQACKLYDGYYHGDEPRSAKSISHDRILSRSDANMDDKDIGSTLKSTYWIGFRAIRLEESAILLSLNMNLKWNISSRMRWPECLPSTMCFQQGLIGSQVPVWI